MLYRGELCFIAKLNNKTQPEEIYKKTTSNNNAIMMLMLSIRDWHGFSAMYK